MINHLTLIQPDDWHVHLRDDAALNTTVPAAARYFGRSIIMPNLKTPVRTVNDALLYRQRILQHRPKDSQWLPLMVLYLTDDTSKEDISAAKKSGIVQAMKYYPAGATTNSASGVTKLERLDPIFEKMQELDLILQMHGEVNDENTDIFDREAVFIDRHLRRIKEKFPELKIVLEHITTEQAAHYVEESDRYLAATITPQHLLFNRNHMLAGGIRPHLYCLPILKRDTHQKALIKASTSGSRKFFLGTDSAPHEFETKESACGCAGCFSHHAALEFYAEVFDQVDATHHLEAFASINGAKFYHLPLNQSKITLVKEPWTIPDEIPFCGGKLIPLAAGMNMNWKVKLP